METAPQTIDRLLSALETLTREEHLLLDQNCYAEVHAIHEREQPLVTRIIELLLQPGVSATLDPDLQRRAQNLLAAQSIQIERLAQRIQSTQTELQQIRAAQSRILKVRPSYGAAVPDRVLSFAGEG